MNQRIPNAKRNCCGYDNETIFLMKLDGLHRIPKHNYLVGWESKERLSILVQNRSLHLLGKGLKNVHIGRCARPFLFTQMNRLFWFWWWKEGMILYVYIAIYKSVRYGECSEEGCT